MAVPRITQRKDFDAATRIALLEGDVDNVYDDIHDIVKSTDNKLAELRADGKQQKRIGISILVSIVIGSVLAILNLLAR